MTDPLALCPELRACVDDLVQISQYLWERGWAERNAGNVSADVTDLLACALEPRAATIALPYAYPHLAGRLYLVSGSGHRFRDLARDARAHACLLRVTPAGDGYDILWGGDDRADFRPTSEFPSHLRVHEYMRETGLTDRVVLHTHPTEVVALTHLAAYRDEAALNRALWGIHPEVKVNLPRGVGVVPYELPGSEILARATVDAFRRGPAVVLWSMHGVVARAASIPEAFDLIDVLAKAARLILLCRSTGETPAGLTPDQVAAIAAAFGLEA